MAFELDKYMATISYVPNGFRKGQWYMIQLPDEIYEKITGTEFDCFYDDTIVPKFFEKISEMFD